MEKAHKQDKGIWCVCEDAQGNAIGVASNDFEYDVLLRVDGDFGCKILKRQYCEWLARKLNS